MRALMTTTTMSALVVRRVRVMWSVAATTGTDFSVVLVASSASVAQSLWLDADPSSSSSVVVVAGVAGSFRIPVDIILPVYFSGNAIARAAAETAKICFKETEDFLIHRCCLAAIIAKTQTEQNNKRRTSSGNDNNKQFFS